MWHVGHGYTGDEIFDKHCIFGNLVAMSPHQAMKLRRHIEITHRPYVKEYVCKIKKRFTDPEEGHMVSDYILNIYTELMHDIFINCHRILYLQEFTPAYTSIFLLKFMMTKSDLKRGIACGAEVIDIVVNSNDSSLDKYCRLGLDIDGRAKITTGWKNVLKAFNLKHGDICLFTFKDARGQLTDKKSELFGAWLRLIITKLEDLE